MTTQQHSIEKNTVGAAPGFKEVSIDEALRASDATLLAQQVIAAETKNLVADRHLGVDTIERERRLEDARLELDHAEAFETALENGNL